MKILLDEGLPRRAAALLRDRGIDAVHLTEVAEASTADQVILERAREDGRIIATLMQTSRSSPSRARQLPR